MFCFTPATTVKGTAGIRQKFRTATIHKFFFVRIVAQPNLSLYADKIRIMDTN